LRHLADSLDRELRAVSLGRLRDSLAAQTEIEISPQKGIHVKGVSVWCAIILFVLGVAAGLVAAINFEKKAGPRFAVAGVVLVVVAAFFVGKWWTRRNVDHDLVQVMSLLRMRPPDSLAHVVQLAPVIPTMRTAPQDQPTDAVAGEAHEPLITRTMVWVLLVLVAVPLTAWLYVSVLRARYLK